MPKRFLRKIIPLLLSLLLLFAASGFSAADGEMPLFGDVDGDGEVTTHDAAAIIGHLKRAKLLDAAALTRADVDGDGAVTERDTEMILALLGSKATFVSTFASFSFLLTSDMHGAAWDSISTDEEGRSTAMNVAACVTALRENEPDLLLFDAGGSLFGSAIADDYRANTQKKYGPITALFMEMQYDAILLGDEAIAYPSQTIRHEVNPLLDNGIPVLGANLRRTDPTVFDAEDALWNDLVPYVICEAPQGEGEPPLRVAVIGMTDPSLWTYDDEILPADPIESFLRIKEDLRTKADFTLLLYHGYIETDVTANKVYSLRDFVQRTEGIDLVVAAHGENDSVRSERNASGTEVPIISLAGGTETVTRISVSLRKYGRPAICVREIDAGAYVPNNLIREMIRPYAIPLSVLLDQTVAAVETAVEAYDENDRFSSSDNMELLHEMQLYAAKKWIAENGLDLPHSVISVAYPYVKIDGFREGYVSYGDLCRMRTETPRYTLMLIRGSELRAWLTAYAEKISSSDNVYSLYGLNYILNTLNPDVPLGYLENEYGISVEDDEVFTLVLAESFDDDSILRPYLDESWLPYEDRVLDGFTLPTPERTQTADQNPVVNAMCAYLEKVGTLRLSHRFRWILI